MMKSTWDEFQQSGVLWFVNRLLHVFGWSIVLSYKDTGEFLEAYPARTRRIGFSLEHDIETRDTFLAGLGLPTPPGDVEALSDEDQKHVERLKALEVEEPATNQDPFYVKFPYLAVNVIRDGLRFDHVNHQLDLAPWLHQVPQEICNILLAPDVIPAALEPFKGRIMHPMMLSHLAGALASRIRELPELNAYLRRG